MPLNIIDIPTELLHEIVKALYDSSERYLANAHLSSLRLTNRFFSHLVKPFHHQTFEVSSTRRVREYLRILCREPALCSSTKTLILHLYGQGSSQSNRRDTADEITADKLTWRALQLPCTHALAPPSRSTRGESARYDRACLPLLLWRLHRLKTLHVAVDRMFHDDDTWEWDGLTLDSLETLEWGYRSVRRSSQQLASLLAAAPRLQHLRLHRCAGEVIMSALSTSRPNVLTSLEITESSLPSLWLQELFTASRGLKHFKYRYESALGPPFNPEPLHSALRMVRATLETLDFNSAHWCLLSSSAKLGPFTDFPRLTTLKTKYHWLLNHHSHHQYHHHSNSSMRLADVLPPRLQQLSLSCCHHSDTDFFADVFDAVASARFKELADLNVAPSGMANACAGTEYSRLAGVCRINRMDFSVYGNPILRFDESGGMIDLDGD